MNSDGNGKTRDVLGEVEFEESLKRGEDRVCIVRSHETGDLSWRFATPQANPLAMLIEVAWHQMFLASGWRARIEELERRVAELEAR